MKNTEIVTIVETSGEDLENSSNLFFAEHIRQLALLLLTKYQCKAHLNEYNNKEYWLVRIYMFTCKQHQSLFDICTDITKRFVSLIINNQLFNTIYHLCICRVKMYETITSNNGDIHYTVKVYYRWLLPEDVRV